MQFLLFTYLASGVVGLLSTAASRSVLTNGKVAFDKFLSNGEC